jgi:uncharacterized protein (DUF2141 family)
MRRSISVLLWIATCAMACAHAADLEVEIRGVKVKTGHIHAALFANAEDFAADLAVRAKITQEGGVSTGIFTREEEMPRPPVETVAAPVNAKTVQIRFTDIPPGVYALALYQDVNDDGKLDTRMDGKPLEPWGLSNNPKLGNRDPTWDEVKFELPPEGTRLVIELQQ